MNQDGLIPNPWGTLRQYTAARIALGRAGSAIPTDACLAFRLAHAQAKDAVVQSLDREKLTETFQSSGIHTLWVESRARDKQEYLTRPDLGRMLSASSAEQLRASALLPADILITVGDGLSSVAIQRHAAPFIQQLLPYLHTLGKTTTPVVIARHARVALGDDINRWVGAQIILMLIGERPGLSSPDSMGAYLTWHTGKDSSLDAERNCISNIRPEGLPYDKAAFKLAWLIEQACMRQGTGIELKDRSDDPACHHLLRPAT